MTKSLSLAIAALLLPVAASAAALPNDKFSIAFERADGQKEDCKISIREIENFDGRTGGRKNVCRYAQASVDNKALMGPGEMTPELLGKEIGATGVKYSFFYEGANAGHLVETLSAWLKFLVEKEGVNSVSTWGVHLKSEANGEAEVMFSDSASDNAYTIKVKLGVDVE